MKGAEIISRAINGTDGIKVSIGGLVYEIMPPTIATISLVGEALSEMKTDDSVDSVLYNIFHAECFARALSRLVQGDDALADTFSNGSLGEIVSAVERGLSLISAESWDKKIGFDEERSDSKTETAGNATLLGQIASFMENLHLTYNEVVHKIPYRNLVVMQKDRLHTVFGKKVHKTSGKDMARRRTQGIG